MNKDELIKAMRGKKPAGRPIRLGPEAYRLFMETHGSGLREKYGPHTHKHVAFEGSHVIFDETLEAHGVHVDSDITA